MIIKNEFKKDVKHKVGPHKTAAGPSAGLHRLHPRWGASFRAPSLWVMNIFGPFTPRFLPVCVLGWMCFISFGLVIRINISFYLATNTQPFFLFLPVRLEQNVLFLSIFYFDAFSYAWIHFSRVTGKQEGIIVHLLQRGYWSIKTWINRGSWLPTKLLQLLGQTFFCLRSFVLPRSEGSELDFIISVWGLGFFFFF